MSVNKTTKTSYTLRRREFDRLITMSGFPAWPFVNYSKLSHTPVRPFRRRLCFHIRAKEYSNAINASKPVVHYVQQ